MRDFYREITDGSLFQMFTFRNGQFIYIDSAFMDDKYGKRNYDSFVSSEGVSSFNACYNKLYDEGKEFIGVRIKSVQMNKNAYQWLSLKTMEGEGLTKENTTLTSKDSLMPIILGHNYKDKFKVGDTLRIYLPIMTTDHCGYDAKVVGILEKNWNGCFAK
ncbi:MAG TPA: hypothetical protein GXZ28_00420 [Clostridiales bacterium]|nr:hypothetical protein [Clostridiales bacterium]